MWHQDTVGSDEVLVELELPHGPKVGQVAPRHSGIGWL